MVQTGDPVRVVYAKLTSTGAYDVVAKTANLPLERARTLAERLLPGNPPLDAALGEEVAHTRHADGGHVVLRFSRYDWSDGERGDVYITDIVWLSDDDFRRARNNAFALVPRTNQVFETLAELPAFTVPERSAEDDREGIAALRDVAQEARTLIAGAAAADPVLLVHPGDRVRALELFTLLLPPSMRARLTFQTQAFRVPTTLPRVTLVDRLYSNLRDGAWKILPSVDVDVPLELAGRLVALADDPQSLALAHDLYDDAYADAVDLRTGIMRLTSAAGVADALHRRDLPGVLRLLASAERALRTAGLRRLRAAHVEPSALGAALVQLLQEGDEGAQQVLSLVRALDAEADAAATSAHVIDNLPPNAPDELVMELAARSARQGDLSRLVGLLATDPRAVAARLRPDDERLSGATRQLLHAVRDATGPRHDLDAAARLLEAAQSMRPSLAPTAAVHLHRICRDAVVEALERTHPTLASVHGMLRLQDAGDDYLAAAGAGTTLPPLLGRGELVSQHVAETAARWSEEYAESTRAVAGAALLSRALDAHRRGDELQQQHALQAASVLLARADGIGRELARQVLAERHVAEHELGVMEGADALVLLLGGNARQAVLVNRLVSALTVAASGDEEEKRRGVRELAEAVFAAHAQRVRITADSELSRQVVGALRAFAAGRTVRGTSTAAELSLQLLDVITDPAHMPALEDAALGTGMAVRLQRLDRSVAHCRAVEDEDRYEKYALALEAADVPIDGAARDRLRDALGTHGLKRRLLRVVSSVIERDAS